MTDPLRGTSPHDLIARALEEDHRAIRAVTPEAQLAHRELAEIIRAKADKMLYLGVAGDQRVKSD